MKLFNKILKFKKERLSKELTVTNTVIHPLFIQIKERAHFYLLENGLSSFNQSHGIEVFKNRSGIYISIVNQGYDFPEVYIGRDCVTKKMIRLDFMLELYLTGKVELTNKHKSLNNFYNFEYEKDFIEKFYESILKISPFPEKYYEWMKLNGRIIKRYTTTRF